MNFGSAFSKKWLERITLQKEEFIAKTFGSFSSNNLDLFYLTTVLKNEGNIFFELLTNDATDGLRIRLKKDCIVSAYVRGESSTTIISAGLSLNTNEPDSNLHAINPDDILAVEMWESNNHPRMAILPPRKLNENDIISLHGDTGMIVTEAGSWTMQLLAQQI